MYNTLGFTLLKACTATCPICCFSSTPKDKEKLDLNRVRDYINESKEIEDIKTIAFTGGEPFLLYDELLELIKLTKEAGKKPNTITNGFWASDIEITYERMKTLKDNGLDYLSLSYDAYHRQYVNSQNIKNILKAATQLDVPTTLSIVKVKDEDIGYILDEIGSDVYTTNIKIVPCLPSGRAVTNFADNKFDRTIYSKNCRCVYGGNLVVLYDGNIYPCCSQEVVETNLSIGNFKDLSLKEALHLVRNNSLLYFLRNTDFDFYVRHAKKVGLEIPEKVVNPCELCAALFKGNNIDLFYDYIVENVKQLKRQKIENA